MKPTIPAHTIEAMDPGRFVVKVGRHVAGHLAEDGEHPGLWIVTDQGGMFMGRHHDREAGAEFLAAWFVAADEDRS